MNEHRRKQAETIWYAGVAAVQPKRCLPKAMDALKTQLGDWSNKRPYLIVGGGKAGAAMACEAEEYLLQHGIGKDRISGWINVPEGSHPAHLKCVQVHPARPIGYNYPTPQGVFGTEQILKKVGTASDDAVILCLISGGGSAILSAPVHEVPLEDKILVSKQLAAAGANIQELNAVRKHLSRFKGGGLAKCCFPSGSIKSRRQLISLVISDVIGDPLDVIASGPTAVDPTTFQDALDILRSKGLIHKAPESVVAYLEAGSRGEHSETLKQLPADEPSLIHRIVANNRLALDEAGRKAKELGFEVIDLGDQWAGDTLNLADHFAQQFSNWRRTKPACVLSGGETTVQLPSNPGQGGRNQSMALALLNRLKSNMEGITILCAGTDGEDGPTDAAGALVDGGSVTEVTKIQLNIDDYLAQHDAYSFFEAIGGLYRTGLTDTNVMDLRVFLIEPKK